MPVKSLGVSQTIGIHRRSREGIVNRNADIPVEPEYGSCLILRILSLLRLPSVTNRPVEFSVGPELYGPAVVHASSFDLIQQNVPLRGESACRVFPVAYQPVVIVSFSGYTITVSDIHISVRCEIRIKSDAQKPAISHCRPIRGSQRIPEIQPVGLLQPDIPNDPHHATELSYRMTSI